MEAHHHHHHHHQFFIQNQAAAAAGMVLAAAEQQPWIDADYCHLHRPGPPQNQAGLQAPAVIDNYSTIEASTPPPASFQGNFCGISMLVPQLLTTGLGDGQAWAPSDGAASLWAPSDEAYLSSSIEYEQGDSPSSIDGPGMGSWGSFGVINTPSGPSIGSPQQFRCSPGIDDGKPSIAEKENPIFDLESSASEDLLPEVETDAYGSQLNESLPHDSIASWQTAEMEDLQVADGMQIEPFYAVYNANQYDTVSNSYNATDFSRLGALIDSGEPWHSQSALDGNYQRAQVFEKPLVPDFHGVSTSTLLSPQPLLEEHGSTDSTHIIQWPEHHSCGYESCDLDAFNRVPEPQWDRKRGRHGALTTEKKKKVKDVRKTGACWPCFFKRISCSVGEFCDHCQKLLVSQTPDRPVLLECFRTPLESLSSFLAPDYIFGHHTDDRLDAFMQREIRSWGRESISINIDWGLQSLIEVEVVAVSPSPHSSIVVVYHSNTDQHGRPQLTSCTSPLLAMPFEVQAPTKHRLANYIQDFVQDDAHLHLYTQKAYDDEFSSVPGRLLKILCDWHAESRRNGEESTVLAEALETHVNCTIIDRSLLLDQGSYELVQRRFMKNFPREAAPRVVQRQLKCMLFSGRQDRLRSVLQKWSKSIRGIKKKTWLIDFCVLAVIVLCCDLTIKSAHESHLFKLKTNRETNDRELLNITRYIETEIFQKAKEVFHARHKTRMGGKASSNPMAEDFDSRISEGRNHDWWTPTLVAELRQLIIEIGKSRANGSRIPDNEESYQGSGRLTNIFLSDFLV